MKKLPQDIKGSMSKVNPDSPSFQADLAKFAGLVMFHLLEQAIENNDKDTAPYQRAQAINSYVKYRSLINEDIGLLVSQIASLSKEKVKILRGELDKRSIDDKVQRGKANLAEIYKFPVVNKKKGAK